MAIRAMAGFMEGWRNCWTCSSGMRVGWGRVKDAAVEADEDDGAAQNYNCQEDEGDVREVCGGDAENAYEEEGETEGDVGSEAGGESLPARSGRMDAIA